MTTTTSSSMEALGGLEDVARRGAYNCACQVGGVDAMSIDTGYLLNALHTIRTDMAAREASLRA